MLATVLRVLFSFAVASLAAGFATAFFATTPAELSSLPPDLAADRMQHLLESGAYAGIQHMIFAAPFALVAAALGEWWSQRNWMFYALAGIAVALVGFLSLYANEGVGQPTIVNNYALTAFVTSGFVGGLVYWLLSGRNAGTQLRQPSTPSRHAVMP